MKAKIAVLGLAVSVVLAGCGGGGGGGTPTTGGTSGKDGNTGSTTTSFPNLALFAKSWLVVNATQSVSVLAFTMGQTSPCHATGGSASYDSGNQVETLSKCALGFDLNNVFQGTVIGPMPSDNGHGGNSGTMNGYAIDVMNSSGATQYTLTGRYTPTNYSSYSTQDAATLNLADAVYDFKTGNASYHILKAVNSYAVKYAKTENGYSYQVTPSQILFTKAGDSFDAGHPYYMINSSTIESVGDGNPTAGTLGYGMTSVSEAATFGPNNAITFVSGDTKQSVTKHWGDADVQAAFANAKK